MLFRSLLITAINLVPLITLLRLKHTTATTQKKQDAFWIKMIIFFSDLGSRPGVRETTLKNHWNVCIHRFITISCKHEVTWSDFIMF